MADYNDNSKLKSFLSNTNILENTNPQNSPIMAEIFDMRHHNTDRRIFFNNKRNLMRFPIIPKQVINGVEVDMGLQESLCKKILLIL